MSEVCNKTKLKCLSKLIKFYMNSNGNLNVINDFIDMVNTMFNKDIDNIDLFSNDINTFQSRIMLNLSDVEKDRLLKYINV